MDAVVTSRATIYASTEAVPIRKTEDRNLGISDTGRQNSKLAQDTEFANSFR